MTPDPDVGPVPHMSSEQFRALGHRMVDWIAAYWERVETLPVMSQVKPGEVKAGLPGSAPELGLREWDVVFKDLERVIMPGITHWQSPNYFAYFSAEASGPAVLGELLSAGLGVQGMLWATSPACTELEERVLDWLVEACGFPQGWRSDQGGAGSIQGSGSDAALVALVAARQRARRDGWDETSPLVVYASDQAHSSIVKGAMVAGMARGPDDRERVRLVRSGPDYAMDCGELERMIAEDVAAGKWPCFVCAAAGTTGTLAFDGIGKVAAAAERGLGAGRRLWVHVDAAHAGSACVCPEYRWMLEGAERADSLCFNPHKWLLTNFDCSCLWVREKRWLVDALSITPEYLRNNASDSGEVTDFRDLQVPLGRRFRALKLWFVIRHYGMEGLRTHIREHVRITGVLESLVRGDDRFEIVGEPRLNLVCFRLRGTGPEADARNKRLLDAINATGRAYLTHTTVPVAGVRQFVLRMAVGATRTQERHVREAWELIRGIVDQGSSIG